MLRTRTRLLVVDDDHGIRTMVRRAVDTEFDVEVLEAVDGFVALERLSSEPVDLVILDLAMPVIDGLEALEAIRNSPSHVTLPVVMFTGCSTERQVQHAMRLNVADFLVKPITIDGLRDRLRPILATLRGGAPERADGPVALSLTAASRVVLVDDSDEYREFFDAQMRGVCRVEPTDSTLVAMRACLTYRPDAVFLGATSALLGADLFARKWREQPDLQGVPLFRLVTPAAFAEDDEGDATVRVPARTLDEATFIDGLRPVLSAETIGRLWLGASSPCIHEMFDTAQRELSGVFGLQMRVQPTGAVLAPNAPRWVDVSVDIRVDRDVKVLKLQCPYTFGLQFTCAHLGLPADKVSDTQICAAVSTAVASIAGELERALQSRGVASQVGTPVVRLLGARYTDLRPRSTTEIGRWFSTGEPDSTALLRLLPGTASLTSASTADRAEPIGHGLAAMRRPPMPGRRPSLPHDAH